MSISLILISHVFTHKKIKGLHKVILAVLIREIVSFHVMNEDIGLDIPNAGQLSTLIQGHCDVEILTSSMGDYLSTASFLSAHIVVALNIEMEVPVSLPHFLVGLYELLVKLHVCDVGSNFGAAESQDKVQCISEKDYTQSSPKLQEHIIATQANSQCCQKEKGTHQRCDMIFWLQFQRFVGFSKGGVSQVEKHRPKSISDTLIAQVE